MRSRRKGSSRSRTLCLLAWWHKVRCKGHEARGGVAVTSTCGDGSTILRGVERGQRKQSSRRSLAKERDGDQRMEISVQCKANDR